MTPRETIDDFLAQRRIAVVGVSRQPQHFSRALFRSLTDLGYDLVPVNPQAPEIEGRQCFARVQEISPPVGGALLMTSPRETDGIVRDCAEAGIARVWMYRATGRGAVSEPAIDFCDANGIRVVPGHCPFMFIQNSGWYHHLHGFLLKLVGSYPR